jgi:hypothetical protein
MNRQILELHKQKRNKIICTVNETNKNKFKKKKVTRMVFRGLMSSPERSFQPLLLFKQMPKTSSFFRNLHASQNLTRYKVSGSNKN